MSINEILFKKRSCSFEQCIKVQTGGEYGYSSISEMEMYLKKQLRNYLKEHKLKMKIDHSLGKDTYGTYVEICLHFTKKPVALTRAITTINLKPLSISGMQAFLEAREYMKTKERM